MGLYDIFILFQKALLYYLSPLLFVVGILLLCGVYPTLEKILTKDVVAAPSKSIPKLEEGHYKFHNWLLKHNVGTAIFLIACAIFFFMVGKSKEYLLFLNY